MKLKTLTGIIATGCILSSTAFGQTLTIAGAVCSCDGKQITVQEGTHYWIVQRTPSTSISGTCSPGQMVTVQCKSPDAQRKEGSCSPTSTPSASSG